MGEVRIRLVIIAPEVLKLVFRDYQIDSSGRPLNPIGRTGISGRGFLGRWGPNHAADPVVSRIKDGKLQFVGIQRRDTGITITHQQ